MERVKPAAERLKARGEELARRGQELREDVERIGEHAKDATSTFRALVGDFEDLLRVEMKHRPWVVLGTAALVGASIGYTLPRWVVRAGLGLGKQMATTAAAQQIAAQAL